jgi:hypothetical protein
MKDRIAAVRDCVKTGEHKVHPYFKLQKNKASLHVAGWKVARYFTAFAIHPSTFPKPSTQNFKLQTPNTGEHQLVRRHVHHSRRRRWKPIGRRQKVRPTLISIVLFGTTGEHKVHPYLFGNRDDIDHLLRDHDYLLY